jgi:hypothetical protein
LGAADGAGAAGAAGEANAAVAADAADSAEAAGAADGASAAVMPPAGLKSTFCPPTEADAMSPSLAERRIHTGSTLSPAFAMRRSWAIPALG